MSCELFQVVCRGNVVVSEKSAFWKRGDEIRDSMTFERDSHLHQRRQKTDWAVDCRSLRENQQIMHRVRDVRLKQRPRHLISLYRIDSSIVHAIEKKRYSLLKYNMSSGATSVSGENRLGMIINNSVSLKSLIH